MSFDWNFYLAGYHRQRGGLFFGDDENACDAHLVLTEGEKTPLLVILSHHSVQGGADLPYLKARTTVRLDGRYELHIRARSSAGGGLRTVAGLMGKSMDFGYPEATKGRVITTNHKAFTKLVLGDLALRNGLLDRPKDHVRVRPAPQGEGWHLVEVGAASLEHSLTGSSPWISDAMSAGTSYMDQEDRDVLLQAGSQHFNSQMDGFLDLLRAARDAVTMWPVPPDP